MAKRTVALLMVVLALLTLTGCGKPKGMSDANYEACKQIVAVYDAYLDFKLGNKEAGAKVAAISSGMAPDNSVQGTYYAQFGATEGSFLEFSDDPSRVLEDRNDLAEAIGMAKR